MDARFTDGQAHNLRKAVVGVFGPAVVVQTPEQIRDALAAVLQHKGIAGQVQQVAWYGGDIFSSAKYQISVNELTLDGLTALNGAAQTGRF
jgi:hypothetical protein